MDYSARLDKLDKHIAEHPKDYQAVIARMKTYSDMLDYERRQQVNIRLKRVAGYRRQLDAKQAK